MLFGCDKAKNIFDSCPIRASLADPASRRPAKHICSWRKNGFAGRRGRPQMQTPQSRPVKKDILGICPFTGQLCGVWSGAATIGPQIRNLYLNLTQNNTFLRFFNGIRHIEHQQIFTRIAGPKNKNHNYAF